MKIYNKKYVFNNGTTMDLNIYDKDFNTILEEINKSVKTDYVSEIVNERQIVTINMKNVNYILVEEKENGISKSRK